ncbi:MAG TPA: alcohol dehydrogenase catalytic domain-containing protein [Planctomycetota bacterium]|nr:alcohol dehydrogenase catalytic domain-containing protein [Planctomycetota bacterium]
MSLRDDVPPAVHAVGAPAECRVAVLSAGLCATDLALVRGYMGFVGVPGHEFVGRALDGPLAGQRVVGEINAGCGRCADCARGDSRHCAQRTVLGILGRNGAFARELSLPQANLLAVPDGIATDEAVFAEPLAAALAILEQVEAGRGTRALVAGDGRLGLLVAHVLCRAGAEVTVAGHHASRAALLPARARHVEGLLERPPARRFDLAVEATGRADSLASLLPHVRPRGTVVLKTTSELPAPLDLSPLVVDEQRLVGSRCGRLAPALELLAGHAVPVQEFIEARYPLERALDALAHAGRRGVLKVLIDVAR